MYVSSYVGCPNIDNESVCFVRVQVKLTDMQVRDSPRDLLPGEPQCAPLPVIMAEAYINLIRSLHAADVWTNQVWGQLVSYAVSRSFNDFLRKWSCLFL